MLEKWQEKDDLHLTSTQSRFLSDSQWEWTMREVRDRMRGIIIDTSGVSNHDFWQWIKETARDDSEYGGRASADR